MEKKGNLYYFESYDEIRSYIEQGFPAEVFLTTRVSAVVKNDMVVASKNHGEMTPEKMAGMVTLPDYSSLKTLGAMEDFPATDYAVTLNPEPIRIEAETMLEGLYKAGDMLADVVHTPITERRERFNAKDLWKANWSLSYGDKGDTLFVITTATGKYQAVATKMFEIIDKAEKVCDVAVSKRRMFTVRPEKTEEQEVLVRFSFEADKVLPKLRGCWSTDDLRIIMKQPAIDLRENVIVSTDGRILALHKLKGMECGAISAELPWDVVNVPREVVSMKGTITAEVQVANRIRNSVNKIRICIRDSYGRYAEVEQKGRYPNYESVFPTKTGPAINIDAVPLAKAVKQIASSVESYSMLMCMKADRGASAITICGEDVYFGKGGSVDVPVSGGVPTGIYVGTKAPLTLKALAFQPTKMRFIDPSRCVVFESADTLMIQMPMILPESSDRDRWPRNDEMVDFSVQEWMKRPTTPPTTPKGKKKMNEKSKNGGTGPCRNDDVTPAEAKPTFAELLRKVLLAA